MQQIGNYPYLEYAWVCAPNLAGQSITVNTLTTLYISTELADLGSYGTLTVGSAPPAAATSSFTLAAGTYQFKAVVPARWTGGPNCAAIIDLYDVTNGRIVTSGPAYRDYGGGSMVLELEGQYTVTNNTQFTLRVLTTSGTVTIDNGSQSTVFTDSTAGLDQRTTIKLWKVG